MTPLLRLGSVVILIGSTLLTGCFGYDRILFVTKTNVGLDVENKPPTAELTIARREIAISPTFRDTIDGHHKTPPLLAAFGRTGGLFTTGLTSHFAGGEAAIGLAKELLPKAAEDEDKVAETDGAETGGAETGGAEAAEADNSSVICLDKEPDSRPPLKKLWHWLTGGRPDENTRAFYFATDTSFGLKVGWDGTGGPYPTNLKLGYNRKELAFPPIFISTVVSGECSKDKDGNELPGIIDDEGQPVIKNGKPVKGYEVRVPSFFASLDNESGLATLIEETPPEGTPPKGAGAEGAALDAASAKAAEIEAVQPRDLTVSHVQFFATGEAATEWVNRKEVHDEAYRAMRGVE